MTCAESLKILQAAPYYPPYLGGQERHVSRLSAALRERGHDVRILTSRFPADQPAEAVQDGIPVTRLPVVARALRNPIVKGLGRHPELLEWAEVVHIHNEHSFIANRLAARRHRNPGPYVLTCHGQLRFEHRLADAFETLYSQTAGRWTLSKMDRVVALSPTDARYLQGLGVAPARTSIIPNAIDFPQTPSDAVVQAFRDKYRLEGSTILFVGPILARKAPKLLLSRLPEIVKDRPGTMAVFLGGGDQLEEMREFARSLGVERNAVFTGRVSEDELYAAYVAADVMVVTSRSEGLPTTILEALSLGTPVVASNLPAITDWFSTTCSIVDPATAELSQAILRLLDDSELRKKMAREGRNLVRQQFTWNQVADAIVRQYRLAIDAP